MIVASDFDPRELVGYHSIPDRKLQRRERLGDAVAFLKAYDESDKITTHPSSRISVRVVGEESRRDLGDIFVRDAINEGLVTAREVSELQGPYVGYRRASLGTERPTRELLASRASADAVALESMHDLCLRESQEGVAKSLALVAPYCTPGEYESFRKSVRDSVFYGESPETLASLAEEDAKRDIYSEDI